MSHKTRNGILKQQSVVRLWGEQQRQDSQGAVCFGKCISLVETTSLPCFAQTFRFTKGVILSTSQQANRESECESMYTFSHTSSVWWICNVQQVHAERHKPFSGISWGGLLKSNNCHCKPSLFTVNNVPFPCALLYLITQKYLWDYKQQVFSVVEDWELLDMEVLEEQESCLALAWLTNRRQLG